MMDLSSPSEEQKRAVRSLLRRPILNRADHPEDFDAVRRNHIWATRWFSDRMGWKLIVDPTAGFARLFKTAARVAVRRRLVAKEKTFTQRDYVILSLTLGILSRGDPQITLVRLDEELRRLTVPASIPLFDPDQKEEMASLKKVVEWLMDQRILVLRDEDSKGDELYDVNGRLVNTMLGGQLGPVRSGSLERFGKEYPDTSEGTNEGLMHEVMRRLFDEPVLYFQDLTSEERTWLESKRSVLYDRAEELGFHVERRAEGLAAIDETGGTTDDKFPRPQFSTLQYVAMQLIGHFLSERWRSGGMTYDDVLALVEVLRQDPRGQQLWSTAFSDPEGRRRLTQKVLDWLEGFGLLAKKEGRWTALPAIWRYADRPQRRSNDGQDIETAGSY